MPIDYLPAALYSHPAWVAWKREQGWKQVRAPFDFPVLVRGIGSGFRLAYALLPSSELGLEGEEASPDYGARLEELSLKASAFLPEGCVALRWDLMAPAWLDEEGRALAPRLQELRMNASTRSRRFRKAPVEHTVPDTMLVELSGGREGVEARMDRRALYAVRLAERRGTRVRRTGVEELGAFHSLYLETAAHRRLPTHPESLFRSLFALAEEQGLGLELYLAESGSEPVAAALFARHGGEAWYLFAASSPSRRASAGPSALLHRAIVDCAESGDRRMDLLGVAPAGAPSHALSGLELFKRGFGGRRRSRAGAWDFVVRPEAYAGYAGLEQLPAARVSAIA